MKLLHGRWDGGGSVAGAVEPEAGEVRDHDRERTGEEPRDEHGRYADLDGVRLRLAEGEAHRDEVAADLGVDREQGRQRVLRRDVALGDAGAEDDPDDLGDDGARTEHRGQDRDRAEDADREQPGQAAGEGLDQVGEPVAEARLVDDADQDGDERHEREDVADDRVDGVAAGLVQRADDPADLLADRDEQVVEPAHPAASGRLRFGGGAHADASWASLVARRASIRAVMSSVTMPRIRMTSMPTSR